MKVFDDMRKKRNGYLEQILTEAGLMSFILDKRRITEILYVSDILPSLYDSLPSIIYDILQIKDKDIDTLCEASRYCLDFLLLQDAVIDGNEFSCEIIYVYDLLQIKWSNLIFKYMRGKKTHLIEDFRKRLFQIQKSENLRNQTQDLGSYKEIARNKACFAYFPIEIAKAIHGKSIDERNVILVTELLDTLLWTTQLYDDMNDLKSDLEDKKYSALVLTKLEYIFDRKRLKKAIYLEIIPEYLNSAIANLKKQLEIVENNYVKAVLKRNLAYFEDFNQKVHAIQKHLVKIKSDPRTGEIGALEFLFSGNNTGLWYDFATSRGISTEWVTGFIAYYLLQYANVSSNSMERQDEVFQETSKKLLDCQRSDGSWGYSQQMCGDSDSTSWVLNYLLLDRKTSKIDEIQTLNGINFIKNRFNADGLVSTYGINDIEDIKARTGMEKIDFDGWTQGHFCVTASALLTMQLSQVNSTDMFKKMLSRIKNDNWAQYWWVSPFYSVSIASESTRFLKNPNINRSIDKFILNHINSDQKSLSLFGSEDIYDIFSVALFANTICNQTPKKGSIQFLKWAVDLIRQKQLSDGSWPGHALLRIPDSNVLIPNHQQYTFSSRGDNVVTHDVNRFFTTVLCLSAIQKAKQFI